MEKEKLTAITQLVRQNSTAKAIFEALMNRERSRQVTDIRQFLYALKTKNIHLNTHEFFTVFRNLSDLGIGEYIKRKGQAAKFKWNVDLRELGREVIYSVNNGNKGQVLKTEEVRKHRSYIFLRPEGKPFELFLPEDLTSNELEQILQLVKEKKIA